MNYSLKGREGWDWSTSYSLQTINDKLTERQIDGDWLVCPLGEPERAVTVSEFIERPSIFTEKDSSAALSGDHAGEESEDVMDYLFRLGLLSVVKLSLVSLDFYPLGWMISRSKTINRYHHHKISRWYAYSVVGLVAALLISFIVIIARLNVADEDPIAIAVLMVMMALVPVVVLISLAWKLAFRRRLLEIARERGMVDFQVSIVATLVMQELYLQSKINELLDIHQGFARRKIAVRLEAVAVLLASVLGLGLLLMGAVIWRELQ